MTRKDLFQECYAGSHRKNLSVENFKHMFCRVCRNPACVNSAVGKGMWLQRMENQEERLLNNPQFADPNDPRFRHLAEQKFQDAVKKAMAREVADRRGDWEIPTQEDMQQLADEIAGAAPIQDEPELAPEVPTGPDGPTGFQEIEVAWEAKVKSKSGKRSYTVSLMVDGDKEQWNCTCPGFRYHQKCSHLSLAQIQYLDEQEREPEPDPEPEQQPVRVPEKADPEAWQQMKERGLVPNAQNTAFPSSGMMVDGSRPEPPSEPEPEVDPWAPPKEKPKAVRVGSKVVLGGKK